MQVLLNDGGAAFRAQADPVLNVARLGWYDRPYSIDLNQDGWPDLVVNENKTGIRLYQNMGGSIEDRTDTLPLNAAIAVPADFDGDGRVDLALIDRNQN